MDEPVFNAAHGGPELPLPLVLDGLCTGDEHVAILLDPARFSSLWRWNDLLDEGVAAIFGVLQGEAELLALSFHAGKFTPALAADWLAERQPRRASPRGERPSSAMTS